jgi:hypothetical protein
MDFLNYLEKFGIIFERLYQEKKKKILGEGYLSKLEWDHDAKSYVNSIVREISSNMWQAAGSNSKKVLHSLISKYPTKANYFNLTVQAAKNGHKQLAFDLSINNDDKNYEQQTLGLSRYGDSKNYNYCVLALGFSKGRCCELLYDLLSMESEATYWADLMTLLAKEGTSDDILFCVDVANKLGYTDLAANLTYLNFCYLAANLTYLNA